MVTLLMSLSDVNVKPYMYFGECYILFFTITVHYGSCWPSILSTISVYFAGSCHSNRYNIMPGAARFIMTSIMKSVASKPASHFKCRAATYPRDPNIKRCPVTNEQVPWDVVYQHYAPVDHTAPSVLAKPVWADPDFRLL